MTTFAHIAPNSNEVLDPRPYDTEETYKASFGGVAESLWADHVFKEVPDGTLHGARDNGDGTYTAPFVPARVLSWDAFDFKMRFTAQERKDIRAASKVNADMEDFVDMLDTAAATGTMIHADNPLVIAALTAMDGTIIASGRKAEILGE